MYKQEEKEITSILKFTYKASYWVLLIQSTKPD